VVSFAVLAPLRSHGEMICSDQLLSCPPVVSPQWLLRGNERGGGAADPRAVGGRATEVAHELDLRLPAGDVVTDADGEPRAAGGLAVAVAADASPDAGEMAHHVAAARMSNPWSASRTSILCAGPGRAVPLRNWAHRLMIYARACVIMPGRRGSRRGGPKRNREHRT
jgi:hypothetical protein